MIAWPDAKAVSRVPHQGKRIRVQVVNVYDGDTCTILVPIDQSFLKLNLRLQGVDCPEMAPARTRLGQMEARVATRVRDHVAGLIDQREFTAQLDQWDKYGGRALGQLWLSREQTLNEYLLAHGLAKPYDGRARSAWTRAELEAILPE